jgi:hypothetical protein
MSKEHMVKPIPYGRQNISEADIQAVVDVPVSYTHLTLPTK